MFNKTYGEFMKIKSINANKGWNWINVLDVLSVLDVLVYFMVFKGVLIQHKSPSTEKTNTKYPVLSPDTLKAWVSVFSVLVKITIKYMYFPYLSPSTCTT